MNYPALSSAPAGANSGDIALADGTNWDPDGDWNAEFVARKAADNGSVEMVDLGGTQ